MSSLVQDTVRCCVEYILICDPIFECECATNLFRWSLVDRWSGRGSFLRLNALREKKCFSSGRNWLDKRLGTYLICVSRWHGWISFFNGFWLFHSEVDWRMRKIWSRDIKISYPATADKFCARNHPVAKGVETEYWFCVFIRVFLCTVIS